MFHNIFFVFNIGLFFFFHLNKNMLLKKATLSQGSL